MLNKLQKKQMDAVLMRLENPESVDKGVFTKGDISLALFNAYIDEINVLNFVNSAIKGLRRDPNDEDKWDTSNLTPVNSVIDFYDKNRLNIIDHFEKSANSDNDITSPIMVMADLIDAQQEDDGDFHYEEITPHDIGLVVYGNDKQHAKYDIISREMVSWIIEKSTDLFFEVASNLKGEPLIEYDYRIGEFLDQQHNDKIAGMGWAQTKYILDTIDADDFAKIALTYPKLDHKNRIDGKIPALKYIDDANSFYDFNRLDTLSWFQDYINMPPSVHKLKQHDTLGSLQLWIDNIGLTPPSGLGLNELASIIYTNNKEHPYYNLIINAITILAVEVLTVSYQAFDSADVM